MSELNDSSPEPAETLSSCPQCHKQHCNGQVHIDTAAATTYIYPVCLECGIELCDLIDLLENRDLRSLTHCEVCDLTYATKSDCYIHFPKHFHRNAAEPSQFYCLDCAAALSIDPFEHFRADDCPNTNAQTGSDGAAASDSNDSTLPPIEKRMDRIDNAADKRYPCGRCKNRYGTELERDFHVRHYHDNTPSADIEFGCPMCDESLTSRPQQQHHLRDVHRNRKTLQYDCPWCTRSFKSESGIIGHAFSHGNVLPYVCSICAKGFNRLRNLQGHYATHNEEQAYACKLCAKTFKTMQLRMKHWRTVHVDEKPLQCEHCDKRYKDHSDLRRHRWTHGGYEKKFQCNVCERKFYEAKLLRIHMRTHAHPVKAERGENIGKLGGRGTRIIEIEMVI